MQGAHRRSLGFLGLVPGCLLSIACASSGTGITGLGDQQGGQKSTAGASSATGSTNSSGPGGGASSSASSTDGSAGDTSTFGGAPAAGSGNSSADGGTSGGATDGGASAGGTSNAVTNGGAVIGNGGSNIGGASTANGGVAQAGNAANGGSAQAGSVGATGGKATGVAGSNTSQAGTGPTVDTCGNSVQDGDETGVDCGGSCAPAKRCAIDSSCVVARDCTTTTCLSGKCAAPIVVAKTSQCDASNGCPGTGNALKTRIKVLNVGTSNLDLKGLEVRYYFTDENSAAGTPVAEVYDKSISTFTISVVAMTTPTATADSYVRLLYSAGTLVPDLNRVCERGENTDCAEFDFSIHSNDWGGTPYDSTNDYSYIPSVSLINNGNITVQRGDEIIWGTPP